MTELDRAPDSLGLMPALRWHLSWEALFSLKPRSLSNHDRDALGRGPGKKSSLGFMSLSSSFIISVGESNSTSKMDAMFGFPKSPLGVECKPKWSRTLAVLAAKQEHDVEVEEVTGHRHGAAIRLERRGRDLRKALPLPVLTVHA